MLRVCGTGLALRSSTTQAPLIPNHPILSAKRRLHCAGCGVRRRDLACPVGRLRTLRWRLRTMARKRRMSAPPTSAACGAARLYPVHQPGGPERALGDVQTDRGDLHGGRLLSARCPQQPRAWQTMPNRSRPPYRFHADGPSVSSGAVLGPHSGSASGKAEAVKFILPEGDERHEIRLKAEARS